MSESGRRQLPTALAALGLVAACAFSPRAVPRGAAEDGRRKDFLVVPTSGPLAGQTVYGASHALLVGVNEYAQLPRDAWLEYAVSDVSAVRELLVAHYGFAPENVTVLTDRAATGEGIRTALASLADRRKVKPDDRVLVYFSGHGQTVKLPGGGDMGFLIPHDARVDLSDMENAGPFLASCLPMKAIWDYLESSPAKHVLLIADACYSGLLTKTRALEKVSPEALAALAGRRAVQVITAGRRGEVSFEMARYGHGAFTYKLVEELTAQAATPGAVFTATELYAAVKRGVANVSGGKQTPQMGDYDTEGDFLFITTRPQPAPPLSGPALPAPAMPAVKVRVRPTDGAEMLFVPAGEFLMGSDPVQVEAAWQQAGWGEDWKKEARPLAAEAPRHRVFLPGYWIDRHEVTFAQFARFLRETGRPAPTASVDGFSLFWQDGAPAPGRQDHPVVCVSWNDARAYAEWVGCRLPTEAEWEKAARGADGRLYPWGNGWDPARCNSAERLSGTPLTTKAAWDGWWNAWWQSPAAVRYADSLQPVGSYPNGASPYGCLDMAGNVWEWVGSLFRPYPYDRADGRDDPLAAGARVVRGGAWCERARDVRCAFRPSNGPTMRDRNIGFRCAISAE